MIFLSLFPYVFVFPRGILFNNFAVMLVPKMANFIHFQPMFKQSFSLTLIGSRPTVLYPAGALPTPRDFRFRQAVCLTRDDGVCSECGALESGCHGETNITWWQTDNTQ